MFAILLFGTIELCLVDKHGARLVVVKSVVINTQLTPLGMSAACPPACPPACHGVLFITSAFKHLITQHCLTTNKQSIYIADLKKGLVRPISYNDLTAT